MQTEPTTAPAPAPGGTTVILDPGQVQTLVDTANANTYAVMLGIGFVILLLSALVFAEILTGRGGG